MNASWNADTPIVTTAKNLMASAYVPTSSSVAKCCSDQRSTEPITPYANATGTSGTP